MPPPCAPTPRQGHRPGASSITPHRPTRPRTPLIWKDCCMQQPRQARHTVAIETDNQRKAVPMLRPMITFAATIAAATIGAPLAAQSVDQDLKCFIASNIFVQNEKDPAKKQ